LRYIRQRGERILSSNQYIHEHPQIHPSAFVAESANLIGAITIDKNASVWYQVVIRADDEPVTIEEGSNIQDGTIIHIDPGFPTFIGKGVTVGHRAIVHGAHLADHVMISMGAIILSGARIGEHSIIGAGTLVTEGMDIPPRSLVLGVPGRIIKSVTDDQIQRIHQTAASYIERRKHYIKFRQETA
jgi:carbonic anhydrase/acetyltransferase-like protein (isoleucine patch superfamily)